MINWNKVAENLTNAQDVVKLQNFHEELDNIIADYSNTDSGVPQFIDELIYPYSREAMLMACKYVKAVTEHLLS